MPICPYQLGQLFCLFVRESLMKSKALRETRIFPARLIGGGLVVVCSTVYFVYILTNNWGGLVSIKQHIRFSQVALFFVVYSLSLLLATLGWDSLIGCLAQIHNRRKNMKYYIFTVPLRRLPTPLAHLFGRIYFYSQDGVSKSIVMMASFLEWVLILLSGAVVFLLMLPFWMSTKILYGLGIVLGTLAVSGSLVHPKAIRFLFRLLVKKELLIPLKYFDVLGWLIVYSLVWIGGGLTLYITANSLYPLSLTDLPIVIGAWVLAGLVSTLGATFSVGFGLKELTLSFLLSFLFPNPLPVVIALLMRLSIFLCEIAWGIFILFVSLLPKRGIA